METLSDQDVSRLFGVLIAEVRATQSLTNARTVVARAGIVGVHARTEHWHPFLAGVDRVFMQLDPEARLAAVHVLADQFADRDKVRRLFAKHRYEYIDGTFVPTALLDQREARYLPSSSASELAKAMKRLVDGDESGAITSACGAVETLMNELYDAHGLGDPSKIAYAAKLNTAMQHLRIFDDMRDELIALGMKITDADGIVVDMRKGTNHAAQMLQTLRRSMGDVHGSKPALQRMAYDAIKWASAICGLFEGR